jgi:hypothetical protein
VPVVHGDQYLWGNTPALDILKLEGNEGESTERNFNLLFAASGDLRNMIETIVSLPNEYKGTIRVVINDVNFNVVAMNIILLMGALHFEPEEAAATILHV